MMFQLPSLAETQPEKVLNQKIIQRTKTLFLSRTDFSVTLFFFSDWVYANPALVMDFDMVTSRGVPSSEAAVSSAAPKSFQNRTLSESSEASDGRRLGRPNSMPPLPAIDYKLPRASVTRPVDKENRQKSSRKAIRTPSGKNMSASDYLRGGYRPSEKSLSEEGMHIFS